MKINKVTKRLIALSMKFKKLFFLTIFMSLISMLLMIITTELSRNVLDMLINENNSNNIMLMIYIIIFLLIQPIFNKVIRARVEFKYSTKTLIFIREKLLESYLSLTKDEADKAKSDNIISRFTIDLNKVSSFATNSFSGFITQIIRLVMVSAYSIYINWKMGILCIILIPLFSFISSKITKPMEKLSVLHVEAGNAENGVLQNALNGIIQIKAYCIEKYMSERYSKIASKRNQIKIKTNSFSYYIMMVQNALFNLPYIILYIIGGILIFRGEIKYGALYAISLTMMEFRNSMLGIPEYFNSLYSAKASAEHIFMVIDGEKDNKGIFNNSVKTDNVIEFSNVYFEYNNDIKVLKNINFNLKKGEKVAVVGSSGCGKTTILKLIEGFYKNYSGDIKILGHDLRQWDLSALRSKISYVSQNPAMFYGSIEQNVKMSSDAEKKEISEALALASISNNENLPKIISKGGTNISGGQRQRIAIARSIIKDAEIIILDEPTSALDTLNEEIILESILNNKKNVSALIVSHRPAALKYVDRIIVVEDGKIVQEGTHENLIRLKGPYSRLYKVENGGN